ncbi:type I restriction enzyme, S subunit [Variovorax sp. CF079]|uniref:restriction endonuclease subunit S n=1 Tax=Variovorax sp. CF079 TaxID=1882774 RepID=UPI000881A6EB|nr:restriction endonuclease subunit S [Variovorax sp. CF079]SDC44938.1 type I restriction enzyme, S subunit [Variovorax sp. CF079]
MSDGKNLKPSWKIWRFDQMATNVNARIDNPSESGMEHYVGLEHLDSDSLKIRRWGTPDDVEATKLMFKKGDIIFGRRRAYQRKLGVAEFDGICSAHAMVLRAKPDVVLPEFLPFFMQSELFMKRAVEISVGSLSPTINWRTMAAQEFALPSKDEQSRLVELVGSIVALEEELRTAEHKANRLQRAAMQDLLDADLNGWPKQPIGQVFKVTTGGTPSRNNAAFWNGDVPWVKTGEVNYYVITSTEERITAEGLNGSAAKLCPSGSVVVALYGQGPTRGRVGMLGIEAAVNQACAAIYPSADFDPWFVYYYLSGKYLSLRAMAQGAAQPNLNLAMIKGFSIPTPPLDEQRAAVASIDAVAKARAEILRRREQAATVKRELREEAICNVVQ